MRKEINLLPKARQREMVYKDIFRSLLMVVWIFIFATGLVVSSQFAANIYLEARYRFFVSETENIKKQVNKKDNAELKAKIKTVNDAIADYRNLTQASPKWSKVVEAFVVLPPEGIIINSFDVEITRKLVNISGYSPTRELVIELYNNIRADSEHFININYPLENVAKPIEINFHFTFNVKENLLK